MAVEAARQCLGDRRRDDIAALYFASTTAPFDDRQNGGIVSQVLRLNDVTTLDVGASLRAGTSALIAAAAMVETTNRPVLVVAAERRRTAPASSAELTSGDGAAAR